MLRILVVSALVLMLVSSSWACNSLDAPGPEGDSAVVIPVDVRPATAALHAPPAISGGTLAVTPDGRIAVAADPDRDRVSLVALDALTVRHVELTRGDEPGRVLAADGGRAYVALRRAGELAVIDLDSGTLVARERVCAAPRGLALQPGTDLLHVACAEGRLVSLRIAAGALQRQRELQLDADLRDVLVQGEELYVSTFKSASLLRVDANGALRERWAAAATEQLRLRPSRAGSGASVPLSAEFVNEIMQPHLAYRTVVDPGGRVFMLHQTATTAEVAIDPESTEPDPNNSSAYGGGGLPCSGIVSRGVTMLYGRDKVSTVPVDFGVLPVDMAVLRGGEELAVVDAGGADGEAPRPQIVFDEFSSASTPITDFAPPSSFGPRLKVVPGGMVLQPSRQSTLSLLSTRWSSDVSCQVGRKWSVPGQSTAVAVRRLPNGQEDVIVQSREPALLSVAQTQAGQEELTVIDLGGESAFDTGHEIFHRNAGGGIACASCHPEGAEDGHTWLFNTVGARRTQALHVGLEGTAPFHWNGEERDIDHLMEDVFVRRMGGVHQSESRLSSLSRWLFSLQPPAAAQPLDVSAAERGEKLFASADVGCRNCHAGDKLTDNRSVDVGTGAKLQVPSLRALAYRAPFMHNGCAQTLRQRFDPACGGSAHGNVSHLTSQQIDDLVVYLQTL